MDLPLHDLIFGRQVFLAFADFRDVVGRPERHPLRAVQDQDHRPVFVTQGRDQAPEHVASEGRRRCASGIHRRPAEWNGRLPLTDAGSRVEMDPRGPTAS